MDRKLVSKQDHEVAYLAAKYHTQARVIRAAMKAVGRSRRLIDAYMKGKRS
jgi:hypothetical protein